MQSAYLKGTEKKVYARDADKLANEKFVCTNCGSTMFLRNGMVRISHFYHASDHICHYADNESELQIRLKNTVFETLSERYEGKGPVIEMEYNAINGCRPDVFIKGRKNKIAIEIIADTIDVREIIERSETYFTANTGVIWLLPFDARRMYSDHPNILFKRFKMKEHEKMLYFMYNKKLLFWNEKFDAITVASFDRAYGDDAEFYDKGQGSMVYYQGKTLRSTFEINNLLHKKYPEDLKLFYTKKRFEMTSYKYYLPKSILWKYVPPKKDMKEDDE